MTSTSAASSPIRIARSLLTALWNAPFVHETLKAWLKRRSSALPIPGNEWLHQENISGRHPRAPIFGRHGPFDLILHVGFLEHAEEHVCQMKSTVLLQARGAL